MCNFIFKVIGAFILTSYCGSLSFGAVADEDGGPFPFQISYIEAGSVADFSTLNHSPSGGSGTLMVNSDGDFEYPTGERIRFFGVNISGSRLFELSHDQAEKEAFRLASLGVNLVRFHHAGGNWVREIPLYSDRTKTLLQFNDNALDRLDYFFAALQRRGIYLTSEMLDSQWAPPELMIKDSNGKTARGDSAVNEFKVRLMFDSEVQDYAKEWIRKFYMRKNRYTGKSLFDDQQLAILEVVNEIQLQYHNKRLEGFMNPHNLSLLQGRYEDYLRQNDLPEMEFDPTLGDSHSARFWLELMRDGAIYWESFLRECGYKGPIAFSNIAENPYQLAAGLAQDYLDTHLYWGYAKWMDGNARLDPKGRWNDLLTPPRNEGYYNNALFTKPALASVPGKPLLITEHRTTPGGGSNPLESDLRHGGYRATGIPFMATVQAFQGWDGFCIYAMHEPEPLNKGQAGRMANVYDVNYDTTYLGTFPIGAFLLRSGAISPAQQTYVYRFDEKTVMANVAQPFFNDAFFNLPEQHRVLNLYPDTDANLLPEDTVTTPIAEGRDLGLSNMDSIIRADTGEFYRNWREGHFVVDAPLIQGCEGFFNETKNFTLKDTTWTIDSDFGVLFLVSRDSQPLGISTRMLFYVGGDCANTLDPTTELSNGSLPGRAPVLLDPVKGSLEFKLQRTFSVWALDESGRRRKPQIAAGVTRFTFDTGHDQTIWYEIVAEK